MGNSRTPSSATAKMKRWKADPYRRSGPLARIWLNEPMCECKVFPPHLGSRCPCDNHEPGEKTFGPAELKAQAQKQTASLDGGYTTRTRCPKHHMVLSANGACSGCDMPVSSKPRPPRRRKKNFSPPERFTATSKADRRRQARRVNGF